LKILTTESEAIISGYVFPILIKYLLWLTMSISSLAFQAVVVKNWIETIDYKIHNLNVTNEITGKTIDDIWDIITGFPSGDILKRLEIVEDKT
jgi:hypothetical protein